MDEIFEYLKQQTYRKRDSDGKQVKIKADEIIQNTKFNEQTVHAHLKRLEKYSGVHRDTYRMTRWTGKGKKYTFTQSFWWYQDD